MEAEAATVLGWIEADDPVSTDGIGIWVDAATATGAAVVPMTMLGPGMVALALTGFGVTVVPISTPGAGILAVAVTVLGLIATFP